MANGVHCWFTIVPVLRTTYRHGRAGKVTEEVVHEGAEGAGKRPRAPWHT